MYSNRRPYYGLKLSIADFFREPVRYLKQSNTQESMMEKPYLIDEYPKMHLSLPDFKYKPKKRHSFLGPIASGVPYGGLHIFDFGEAKCRWDIARTGACIEEPVTITLNASYLFTGEFNFTAQIAEDTIGVTLSELSGTEAGAWDEQDYLLTFPENANGSVTICGSASTHTLVSQTFETVVAGMPVGIYLVGGALVPIEKGQVKPAVAAKSIYGIKGASCGCITIESSCDPCIDIVDFDWDYGSSAETVAQSDSVGVFVADGLGPYDWSVSGTGFTLNSTQTAGVSNTLNADAESCGGAEITVTDACENSTTGYVRSTVGQWVLEEHNTDSTDGSCSGGGFFWWLVPGCSVEKTAGKYREYCTWQKAQCDCYSGPVLAQSCTGAFDQCIPEAEWEECQYTCGNHIRATSYLRYVWEC